MSAFAAMAHERPEQSPSVASKWCQVASRGRAGADGAAFQGLAVVYGRRCK
jgi:hypothetical protein